MLYGFANSEEIKVLLSFEALIVANKTQRTEIFYVVNNSKTCLLSKNTALLLGCVSFAIPVYSLTTDKIKAHPSEFPRVPNRTFGFKINKSIPPVRKAIMLIPPGAKELVKGKLLEMLEQGIIEPAKGVLHWINPFMVVPKKNGEVRLVIDMRCANKAIFTESFHLPSFNDIGTQLDGAKLFSTIDLKSAYHHLPIDEESRKLTAFMTDMGVMRFTRLPFGASSSPEIFTNFMNEIFAGTVGAIVYLDDILIWGRSKDEHDSRLNTVLNILKANNLSLNENKCHFNQEVVDFVGLRVSKDGVSVSPERTEAILKCRAPNNVTELKSFLGMISYVAKFIRNHKELMEPLEKLLKTGEFKWGAEQDLAFKLIKGKLAHADTLKFFSNDPKVRTILTVDASPTGVGACLVQIGEDGIVRPICFAGRRLSATERNYPQPQREALAVVYGVKKFHFYLSCRKFHIQVDNSATKFIFERPVSDGKRAISRAHAWAYSLSNYSFTISHIPGEMNFADPLSRLVEGEEPEKDFEVDEGTFINSVEDLSPSISLAEIKEAVQTDEELNQVMDFLASPDCDKQESWPKELWSYYSMRKWLTMEEGLLLKWGPFHEKGMSQVKDFTDPLNSFSLF